MKTCTHCLRHFRITALNYIPGDNAEIRQSTKESPFSTFLIRLVCDTKPIAITGFVFRASFLCFFLFNFRHMSSGKIQKLFQKVKIDLTNLVSKCKKKPFSSKAKFRRI